MSEENVEIVRKSYAAWNRADLDAMLALLHPDGEYVTTGLFPGLAPVYRGHAGFRDFCVHAYGDWGEALEAAGVSE